MGPAELSEVDENAVRFPYLRRAYSSIKQRKAWLYRRKPIFLVEKWCLKSVQFVKAWNRCCDRKSRAAYARSFALWQQATTEFTCHDHSPRPLVVTFNGSPDNIGRASTPRSLYHCMFAPHIWMMLFFTHIPLVGNHTFNATPPERLQQHPLLFTTNRTNRTFFVWRLNSARPSHPGHSTILLRSEIPSGMCAKLRTVAARNSRNHARNLSCYCLLAPHIWWWYSSRTSRSWWIIQL